MTREEFIKDLTRTLCLNYDMPEEFATGLAEFLYDEDYRKIDTSSNQIKGLECCANFECDDCPYKKYSHTDYKFRCNYKLIAELKNMLIPKEPENESNMSTL